MPEIATIGESLYWSYANLAMAHSALKEGRTSYGRTSYMIRARLYKGLKDGTMDLGSIVEDERLKLTMAAACCYCASTDRLQMDHVVAKHVGGADTGENLVYACRSCNSSKGKRDLLVWFAGRGEFPSLMVLRRYLKLVILYCRENELIDRPLTETDPDALPFSLTTIPHAYPPLGELRVWVGRP